MSARLMQSNQNQGVSQVKLRRFSGWDDLSDNRVFEFGLSLFKSKLWSSERIVLICFFLSKTFKA